MRNILATAEVSGVDVEWTKFDSCVQGRIVCDGLSSFVSALGISVSCLWSRRQGMRCDCVEWLCGEFACPGQIFPLPFM